MPVSDDDADTSGDGPRSGLLTVVKYIGLALMVLYGFAIMIGRFMQVNVVELTLVGIWNALAGLVEPFLR